MEDRLGQNCKHYVKRKKRYCRMTVKKGDEYCGEHQPQEVDVHNDTADGVNAINKNERSRITCPLDPKHTCYANKLKQHLKKCNAKPTKMPPYIHKNINSVSGNNLPEERRLLANVPIMDLLQVIEKVNKLHNDVMKETIQKKDCTHPILEEELSNPLYGESRQKHLIQTAAIIGLMKEYNLLQPDTCYIEFGAGKGKLSYWVAKTLQQLEYCSSSVLLIERASHRHKLDNKLDKSTGIVERIRADIADLVLLKVDAISKVKNVVGLTKHLCGDATDLALRCLINSKTDKKTITGMIMAFCCHHRCRWPTFTGQRYFEEHGLFQSDFDVMCGLVSWAICGTGSSREHRQNNECIPNQSARDTEIGLDREQKAEIGRKCKNLLNWGRKQYMIEHGFNSTLCYYVDSVVSLENVCVVGVKDCVS